MNAKADESAHIRKARNKIRQKLQKADKKMSPEALHAMSCLIKEKLKQKNTRSNLKKRQIISFDENQHPAQTKSKFIIGLIKHIKNEQNLPEKELEGRIRTITQTDS